MASADQTPTFEDLRIADYCYDPATQQIHSLRQPVDAAGHSDRADALAQTGDLGAMYRHVDDYGIHREERAVLLNQTIRSRIDSLADEVVFALQLPKMLRLPTATALELCRPRIDQMRRLTACFGNQRSLRHLHRAYRKFDKEPTVEQVSSVLGRLEALDSIKVDRTPLTPVELLLVPMNGLPIKRLQ